MKIEIIWKNEKDEKNGKTCQIKSSRVYTLGLKLSTMGINSHSVRLDDAEHSDETLELIFCLLARSEMLIFSLSFCRPIQPKVPFETSFFQLIFRFFPVFTNWLKPVSWTSLFDLHHHTITTCITWWYFSFLLKLWWRTYLTVLLADSDQLESEGIVQFHSLYWTKALGKWYIRYFIFYPTLIFYNCENGYNPTKFYKENALSPPISTKRYFY